MGVVEPSQGREAVAGAAAAPRSRWSGRGPALVEDSLPRAPDPASLPGFWTWIESAVLAGYAAVVALGIAWHEPWADEAQAWLLARDNGWWHLMAHSIRYEGSPGLWHSLLWLLVRLHIGYTGMHWISGVIAAAGVCVLLRWSPFPLVLRILLPFGFWLAYQDAVVARSYVLFAVIAFPAAALIRSLSRGVVTPGRLLWLAVLLGLMANVSVHGFVASLGFAVVAWGVLRRQSRTGMATRRMLPALVLCGFWVFAVATTFPPASVAFPAGENVTRSAEKLLAGIGDRREAKELKAESAVNTVRPGELAPLPPIRHRRTAAQSLWDKIGRILSLITYPVSNFRWLALALCGLAIAQAIAFRHEPGHIGWVGLLPWMLMVLVFTFMYMAPRHAGMLWETLLASLWLTWPSTLMSPARRVWLRRAAFAALVLVSIDQIAWTAHCVRADVHGPYSGDVAMARFLKADAAGKRVAGFGYHTVGVAALFSHRIFFNQPHAYWFWNSSVRVDPQAPAAIATHPDVIVVGGWNWSPRNGAVTDDWIAPDLTELDRVPLNDPYRIVPYAEAHGYRVTHRFCGRSFIRDGYAETLCEVALQPAR